MRVFSRFLLRWAAQILITRFLITCLFHRRAQLRSAIQLRSTADIG